MTSARCLARRTLDTHSRPRSQRTATRHRPAWRDCLAIARTRKKLGHDRQLAAHAGADEQPLPVPRDGLLGGSRRCGLGSRHRRVGAVSWGFVPAGGDDAPLARLGANRDERSAPAAVVALLVGGLEGVGIDVHDEVGHGADGDFPGLSEQVRSDCRWSPSSDPIAADHCARNSCGADPLPTHTTHPAFPFPARTRGSSNQPGGKPFHATGAPNGS